MQLIEVLELLNSGKTTADIAIQVRKNEYLIENKLKNAAIEFDSESGLWKYRGKYSEKSLCRSITNKIVVLKEDKPYVRIDKKQALKKPIHRDLELELMKEYVNTDHSKLLNKKSFFLNDEIYRILKDASTDKSIRINALLHILISKGIEYYELNNDIN